MAVFSSGQKTHRLETRDIRTPEGHDYRLFMAVPHAPPPPGGYPVLYALDGNAAFDELDGQLLADAAGLVIVAVGYDTPLRFLGPARARDYTPSPTGAGLVRDPHTGRLSGGGDLFLERLCGTIRDGAERDLPVDASRRTLWGHSLAGMLALYTLFARPGDFARIASASPALWWGDEWLLRHGEAALLPEDIHVRIMVMLGDAERRSGNAEPHWSGPAPFTLKMAEILARNPGLDVSTHVFEGHGHAQSLVASLPLAMKLALM